MYNDILKIGPLTIHGYGLMIAIGVFAALLIGEYRAKKKGLGEDEIYPLTMVCVISGVLGAKLLYCIVDWRTFLSNPIGTFFSTNGFVVYGGIIGGTFCAWLYCMIRKLDFWAYFDIVLPSVAIAQGFGRIGCFLAGCCYGAETDSRFGIVFHNSKFAPNGVRLIPTQLISAAGMFAIAFVLFAYAKKAKKTGQVGALYMILYSAGRFLVEFLRNDHRGEVGIFSTSQFISIFIMLLGIVLLVLRSKFGTAFVPSDSPEREELSKEGEGQGV